MEGVGRSAEPVKVVIINTEYVETDARSFKSVVQKLTGKDSNSAVGRHYHQEVIERSGISRKLASMDHKAKRVRLDVDHEHHKVSSGLSGDPILMGRDLSFTHQFERLLEEMPSVPVDELYRLWADI